jgi:acetolactate synthase-1/2/3 large subunit
MNESTGACHLTYFLHARGQAMFVGVPSIAATILWETLEASVLRTPMATDEAAAGLLALESARNSGRAGVCVVPGGIGVASLAGVIAVAWQQAQPLVCLAIESAPHERYWQQARNVRSDRVIDPITKANFKLREIDDLIDLLPEAFRIAEHEMPGPVLLELPDNLLSRSLRWRSTESRSHGDAMSGPHHGGQHQFLRMPDSVIL